MFYRVRCPSGRHTEPILADIARQDGMFVVTSGELMNLLRETAKAGQHCAGRHRLAFEPIGKNSPEDQTICEAFGSHQRHQNKLILVTEVGPDASSWSFKVKLSGGLRGRVGIDEGVMRDSFTRIADSLFHGRELTFKLVSQSELAELGRVSPS